MLRTKSNLRYTKPKTGLSLWPILIKKELLRLGGARIKNVKILSKIDLKMKPLKCKERLFYLDLPRLYVCHMSKS